MTKPVTKKPVQKKSLWTGPQDPGPHGGVSQSMLGKFLIDPERFRLAYVEGLREPPEYSPSVEYGNMWHICEEHYRRGASVVKPLKDYVARLLKTYPESGDKIHHWYRTCQTQWGCFVVLQQQQKRKVVLQRTPVFQEEVFDVRLDVPGIREPVRVRGKYDSVDYHGKVGKGGLYIQENKLKGDVDEQGIQSTIHLDLQSGTYVCALMAMLGQQSVKVGKTRLEMKDVAGVVYNVVRRPFADWRGRNNIKQKKGETDTQFQKRLSNLIYKEKDYYFFNYKVQFTPARIADFRKRILDPVLRRLVTWWSSIQGDPFNPWTMSCDMGGTKIDYGPNPHHYQMPFGIFNGLADGRRGEFFEFITTGSTYSLEPRTLFSELKE